MQFLILGKPPLMRPTPRFKSSRSPRFSSRTRFHSPFLVKRTGNCAWSTLGWDDVKVILLGMQGRFVAYYRISTDQPGSPAEDRTRLSKCRGLVPSRGIDRNRDGGSAATGRSWRRP